MINAEYLKFFGIGNTYELKSDVNLEAMKHFCETSPDWVDRGRGIHTLSLTSIDGTMQTSLAGGLKYIDGLNDLSFKTPTPPFYEVNKHIPLLDDFKSVIGRTRIFKADPGGVWEPHRDGSSAIRILIPLVNCDWVNFRLMVEDKCLRLEAGRAYVVNTLLEHAAVCFTNTSYILVLTVSPTDETAKILYKRLQIK